MLVIDHSHMRPSSSSLRISAFPLPSPIPSFFLLHHVLLFYVFFRGCRFFPPSSLALYLLFLALSTATARRSHFFLYEGISRLFSIIHGGRLGCIALGHLIPSLSNLKRFLSYPSFPSEFSFYLFSLSYQLSEFSYSILFLFFSPLASSEGIPFWHSPFSFFFPCPSPFPDQLISLFYYIFLFFLLSSSL